MDTLQKSPDFAHPLVDEGPFREQVLRELEDIREEVKEACSLDSGTAGKVKLVLAEPPRFLTFLDGHCRI